MRCLSSLLLLSWLLLDLCSSQQDPSQLDWLVKPRGEASLSLPSPNLLRLSNSLVTRDFLLSPAFATWDLHSGEAGASLLRAFSPEARLMVTQEGGKRTELSLGGLQGQEVRGYLNRTGLLKRVAPLPGPSLVYSSYSVSNISSHLSYTPGRGAPASAVWPPRGLHLTVRFVAGPSLQPPLSSLSASLHFLLYDHLPLLTKWVEVQGPASLSASLHTVEELAVEGEWAPSSLAGSLGYAPDQGKGRDWLHVETDQPHGTMVEWHREDSTVMHGATMPVVRAGPSPPVTLPLGPGSSLTSCRVHLLLVPSDCRERRGLARRKMLRTLAPWTLENPIFFHMTNSSSVAVRKVLDQMAEVGFEMMIYSFGSGFSLESQDPAYLARVRGDIAYAHWLGIEVGGYDLIALTRAVKKDWMAVNKHSNSSHPDACFASRWYDRLLNRTLEFIEYTGLSMLETDGPYGGYLCASQTHGHHAGEGDSVYHQNRLQGEYFSHLRQRGVYINQPDTYWYQGGSKTGMGYDEQQFSLPRWQDLAVSRQTLYDNTFNKVPSVGWMFMPLVLYEGGGPEAVFEPLQDHLAAYSWGLAQYLGAGVAACYRGHRLYDTNTTREVVRAWVSFYKKHREVLGSDLVHVRRANMQGLDAWLHVNPGGREKGLAMVFNPTGERLVASLPVSLYYTGLVKTARVAEVGGAWTSVTLARDYKIHLHVDLPPVSFTYFIIM